MDEPNRSALPEVIEPRSILSLIGDLARDPNVDVTKMQALVNMHRDLAADHARREYFEAMNRAQEEIQPVARTTENTQTHSFYAKLEAVDAAIRPIYLKHGFAISRNTVQPLTVGNIRVEVVCMHSGHVEKFYREAGPDVMGPKGTPNKTVLHGSASTETFLTRYAICGVFNVIFKNQDDDGVGGLVEPADCAALRSMIAKVQALDPSRGEAAFCRYMEIKTLADMPKHALTKAISALEQALAKLLTDRPEGTASQTAREGSVTRPPSQPSGRAKPGMREES